MSRKKPKANPTAGKGIDIPPPPDEVLDQAPNPAAAIRRRRTKRLIFVGVVIALIPVVEMVAYRYRSILVVIRNESDAPIRGVVGTYPGGTIEVAELKPGGEATRAIRPDYSFRRDSFSSYLFTLRVRAGDGVISYFNPHQGTVDYSAQEVFVVAAEGENGTVAIRHTTRPGFPLGAFRDLLTRLGVR